MEEYLQNNQQNFDIKISIESFIDLTNSDLIIAFPGLGSATVLSANYLIKLLGLTNIGYITSEEFPSIIAQNVPKKNSIGIYGKKQSNGRYLIIILSDFKIEKNITNKVSNAIFQWAKEKSIRFILCLEGMTVEGKAEDKETEFQVFGIGSTEDTRQLLNKKKILQFNNGIIAGVSGVLLNIGKDEKYPVATFLIKNVSDEKIKYAVSTIINVINKFFELGFNSISSDNIDLSAQSIPQSNSSSYGSNYITSSYSMSDNIDILNFEDLDLRDSVIIISFPSIGIVSTIAGNYLIDALKLRQVGCITSLNFPALSIVHSAIPLEPVRIYSGKYEGNKKITIILSEFRPTQKGHEKILNKVLDWIKNKNSKIIFSFDGIADENINFSRLGDKIYGIGTNEQLLNNLQYSNIELYQKGTISDFSATLINLGKEKNLDIILLIVPTNPKLPNPDGASNVLENMSRLIGLRIDITPLYEENLRLQKQMEKIKNNTN